MCSTMHSELERCTLFNEELRTSRVFCSELKAQYQTSLGLGESFSNDSVARKSQDVAFRSLEEAPLTAVLGVVVQVEANKASLLAQGSRAWAVASLAQFPFGAVAYASIF